MKRIILVLLAGCLAYLPSCKKSDKDIIEEQLRLAQNAKINKSIKDLNDKFKSAKDDAERSAIMTAIADLQNQKGRAADAMKASEEAIKYLPTHYLSHYNLGRSYLELGRYKEAAASLEYSIQIKKDYAPSHYELGNAYYKLNRYPAAMQEYRTAIGLDPKHHLAMNNLAVLLNQSGNSTEALATLNKVVALKADYAPAHKNLGIIYETKMKDFGKAVECYQKYLQLCPNAQDRSKIRKWMTLLKG